MTFTKIKKGEYKFKGIDSWTNKEIEGKIVYQPYDVKLNQVWHVEFVDKNGIVDSPYFSNSLKDCKNWLTN